ncbi:nucleotidyltransferase family protein [Novosphingobium sp. 1949]|uniref:Nucleotidyltransferase family protein n=1 Tax=Novosphingobium organovorum TaxID=2930092 RepID=A0ABT0BCH7_9SPHN|nr:nucleotidyltransferase family protein [Novosphingobium organovorum]MCJ2182732.1 nucleotidyltransferase family protein [Novosphingobium organovorum]
MSPLALPPSALVLAGSRPGAPDPVATEQNVSHKALIAIDGEPMLARVVRALRDGGIARVAVIANNPEVVALAQTLGCEVLPAEAGPSASVAAGFAHLGAPMLVTTSDHALLQPQWVRDFIADTGAEADVALMLARREDVERALPGSKRTWLTMADGAWSGCNLFLLAKPGAEAAIETWKGVEADRKRPWRIAIKLGPGTLLRFALRRLTMAEAIARLGARIGVTARLVAARDGLAAVDVDKPSDLDDVRAILAQKEAN